MEALLLFYTISMGGAALIGRAKGAERGEILAAMGAAIFMGPFAWLVLFIKPNTTTQPDANPAPPAPARVVPPPTHTGFVYLLSNPAMPGLVKIGQTIRPVEARVAELSAYTGVPAPFVIEVTFASHNPVADEKRVHTHLALDRLQAQREFFRMEVPQAIETITRICGGPPHYCRRQAAHERGERP